MEKFGRIIIIFVGILATSFAQEYCRSISCVHAASTILERINLKVDPCNDFYEYACGTFLEKTHPPDDKNVVDTLSLTAEKLTEQLLTLLSKPTYEGESKLHQLAKETFASCLNTGKFYFNSLKVILVKIRFKMKSIKGEKSLS